jgi:DNA-binding transcriptional regulator YdaS (Cro superfamily)
VLNNISTKELAEFLGTSSGFVSQIKMGHRKLPPKDCVRVSKKYQIPLHELRADIFPPELVTSSPN